MNNRFRLEKESETFLSTVLATAKSRIETIKPGALVYRSQGGCIWKEEYDEGVIVGEITLPYSRDRMLPLSYSAKEGRANPKGIPVLYVSNKLDTALAESRPWLNSYISLAYLEVLSEQKIIMCISDQKKTILYFEEPEPSNREKSVWHDIDSAFSRPIEDTDDTANYIPTQIIAEVFKINGYNGIAYRSSLGAGYNIVLFDLSCVRVMKTEVFTTDSLSYKFSQASNAVYYPDKDKNA